MNRANITLMRHILLFTLVSLCLSACGGSTPSHQSGMTPMPKDQSPSDEVLFESAAKYIASKGAPPNSVYDHIRVDLNNDGLSDGIILFKLPHTYWCGWDGCGMVIFKAGKKTFTPMTAMSGVRGPIYISKVVNKGWRDIIIRTSGTNMRDKNVMMRFDGRNYPQSPMLAPTLRAKISDLPTDRYFR